MAFDLTLQQRMCADLRGDVTMRIRFGGYWRWH